MNENKPKKPYTKPASEIVILKLEQPILGSSAPDFGDGGSWGF